MRGRRGHLELGDLAVRPWRPSDAMALERAVAESLDHLRPWMPWVAHEPVTTGERRALIRRWRRQATRGGDIVLGILLDGEVVGSCGLHGRGALEIGYWVHRAHLGQGIATRATAGLITLAFLRSPVTSVEIHHDRANGASRRVPEKLGFELTGERVRPIEAPGEVGLSCIWRMERVRWRDPFGWRVVTGRRREVRRGLRDHRTRRTADLGHMAPNAESAGKRDDEHDNPALG